MQYQGAAHGRGNRNSFSLGYYLLFPATFIYLELLFKISTVSHVFSLGTLYTVLFSAAYGGLCYLLTSISKNRRVNRIISLVLIAVVTVIFLVEYFVYREFKIFYDVSTVVGGAGDAAGGFADQIFGLIFSFNGISKIVLSFVPFVAFLLFGRRFAPAKAAKTDVRVLTVFGVFVIYVFNLVFLSSSSIYGPMYSSQYNFMDAVSNFGLITGIRLDIKNLSGGSEAGGFETVTTAPVTTTTAGEGETSTTTAAPKVYGDNVQDIDFAALAANTSNKTLAGLDEYVSTLTPSKKNEYTGLFKGKNLIMISAEAFCAEVIDEKLTPTLYRLATKGINFTDYYQPASAGTTGGEYENLIGMLPMQGGKSFKNSANHNLYYTMGNQLNRLGYYGKAYHNNTYTYYDRDKTHINLGYSDGYMGYGNGMEEYVTKQWPESDLEMIQGTLPTYIDKAPFNIYYMSVSGHGTYSQNGNAMSKKNWDKVADLNYSDPVKGYLASNLELEAAMSYLVQTLEEKGIADDTVICISADHFPYSLDDDAALGNMPYLSELYGYEVTNYLERDHNRLILWCGSLEKEEPIVVDSPTFSLDIVPTLSNLFGTEFDSRLLPGRDVLSDAPALIFNTGYDWKTDLGTYISSKGTFIPKDSTVTVPDGYVDSIKAIVRNKINFCKQALETDYYAHVFG
ncbi:MAG: sulfatase-like hydrolase/transferase [Firmicutes bacterium]|nr:sulfatase-like hydrolase/transferase [Bacillota bacterium]